MLIKFLPLALLIILASCSLFKSKTKPKEEIVPIQETKTKTVNQDKEHIRKYCMKSLKNLPGNFSKKRIENLCGRADELSSCKSVKGSSIYHVETQGLNDPPIKILVFAIIHGDEPVGGAVTRTWMERLDEMAPRNSWRIIPILNPDGLELGTRMNHNGVDLNRNFPTEHWDKEAYKYWSGRMKKDKRRFPGKTAASEPETKCAMAHIDEYNPDLIIAVHTPLGILDFDGPKIDYPKGAALPWIRLGHYPGSLGRYMWKDNKTPVLTIELKGESFMDDIGKIDKLQDLSGMLAIMATKEIEKNKAIRN